MDNISQNCNSFFFHILEYIYILFKYFVVPWIFSVHIGLDPARSGSSKFYKNRGSIIKTKLCWHNKLSYFLPTVMLFLFIWEAFISIDLLLKDLLIFISWWYNSSYFIQSFKIGKSYHHLHVCSFHNFRYGRFLPKHHQFNISLILVWPMTLNLDLLLQPPLLDDWITTAGIY